MIWGNGWGVSYCPMGQWISVSRVSIGLHKIAMRFSIKFI